MSNLHQQAGDRLAKLIGHTPMLVIRYLLDGKEGEILVKCEQYNLTGSIKDRIVLAAIKHARDAGELKPEHSLLHIGAGNTAISLGGIAKVLGYGSTLLVTSWENLAFQQLLKERFHRVEVIDSLAALNSRAMTLEAYGHVHLPLAASYDFAFEVMDKQLGREIGYTLLLEHFQPAAWVAGTGSGATLRGVAAFLGRFFPDLSVHPVAVHNADRAAHRVFGLQQQSNETQPLLVAEADAIALSRKLYKELQVSAGFSSGANLAAAIVLQQQISGRPVVTIFPDDHRRYDLSVLPEEEKVPAKLADRITLVGKRELKPVEF